MYYVSGNSQSRYMDARGSYKHRYLIILRRIEEGTAGGKFRVRVTIRPWEGGLLRWVAEVDCAAAPQ